MNSFKILLALILTITISLSAIAVTKQKKANIEIGQITSLTAGKLYIKEGKKDLVELHQNDPLHLGDKIIAGDGAKATLQFSRPKKVSPNEELIFIQPIPGEEYDVNVKLENPSDGLIQATINP